MKVVDSTTNLTKSLTTINQGGNSVGITSQNLTGNKAFSPGQTILANIIEKNGSNMFTMETGGKRFLIESNASLAPGQVVPLRVLSTEPTLQLQLTENNADRYLGKALASLGNAADFSSISDVLQQASAFQQQASGNTTALQTLQDFLSMLQKYMPTGESGTNVLIAGANAPDKDTIQQLASLLQVQTETLLATGDKSGAVDVVKSTLQNVAALLQKSGDINQAAQSQIEALEPQTRLLYENLTTLQISGISGDQNATGKALGDILQQLGIGSSTTPNSANIGQAVNTFTNLLTELLPLLSNQAGGQQGSSLSALQGPDTSQKGKELQQIVEKLGLHLEHLLAAGKKEEAEQTVKLNLMKVVQDFSSESDVAESGKGVLNTIEVFQLAQIQALNKDSLIVPLPLPFLERSFLLIDDYKGKSRQNESAAASPNRFSLFLKLSPLGNLRIDFLVQDQNLYLRFNTDNKEVSNFISDSKEELERSISNAHIIGVSYNENAEDPFTALIKSSRANTTSLFDTKA